MGVTGYLVTETATAPLATAPGWTTPAPTAYTVTTAGSKTLYAWAKDAANNVSASRSATVTITLPATGPEPAGWYAGDPHVHRSCGGTPEAVASLQAKMGVNDLACISLLADMGNGEVQNPGTDLPLVNGQDDPISTPGRLVHWDAEWHWDAVYTQYPHQALGGHVLALGLTEAHQIWDEYTYPIFTWARQQNGIAGFAHMQYLDDGIPREPDLLHPDRVPGRGGPGGGRLHLGGRDRQRLVPDGLLPAAQYRVPPGVRRGHGRPLRGGRARVAPDLCPGRGRPDDLPELDRRDRRRPDGDLPDRPPGVPGPDGQRHRHPRG